MSEMRDGFSLEELGPELAREARAYRHTDDLPRDAVWAGIEWQVRAIVRGYRQAQSAWGVGGWLRLAATLILGIYLGRSSLMSPGPADPGRDRTIATQVQQGWKRVVVAIAADDRSELGDEDLFDDQRISDPLMTMPVADSGMVHGVVRWTRNLVDTVVARAEAATERLVGGRAEVQDQKLEKRK
jgi:hypothetical protein